MVEALKTLFWGTFLATFRINIGPVSILPVFVGFMIVSSGINDIYKRYSFDGFKRASDFSKIAIILSFLGGAIDLFSAGRFENLLIMKIWPIVLISIELIMFYSFFEGISQYLFLKGDKDIAGKHVSNMRIYIIISIVDIVLVCFSSIFNFNNIMMISYLLAIGLRISVMIMISGCKDIFAKDDKTVEDIK